MKKSKLIMLMSLFINKNEVIGMTYGQVNGNGYSKVENPNLTDILNKQQEGSKNINEKQENQVDARRSKIVNGVLFLSLLVLTLVNFLVNPSITETSPGMCNPDTQTCYVNTTTNCLSNGDCPPITSTKETSNYIGFIIQGIVFLWNLIAIFCCKPDINDTSAGNLKGKFKFDFSSILRIIGFVITLLSGLICFLGEWKNMEWAMSITGNTQYSVLGYIIGAISIFCILTNLFDMRLEYKSKETINSKY